MRTVALLGGTGFIGSVIANRLTKTGEWQIRVLSRNREQHRHLLVMPTLQVLTVDPYDEEALLAALEGVDLVINLVGILNERGDDGSGFHQAHVALTARLLSVMRRAGVGRYLHMSSLRADPAGPSHYLKTKGEAQQMALAADNDALHVTVFCPSVVFGKHDGFFNRFAQLLRIPGPFPLVCGDARFAPVYVGDVAEAFVRTVDDKSTYGKAYELCGPREITMREVIEYLCKLLGMRKLLLPLPPKVVKLQAEVFERLPGKPFSRDNLRSLSIDSISTGAPGLAELGITPTPVESVVPTYIGSRRSGVRFDTLRTQAGRDSDSKPE